MTHAFRRNMTHATVVTGDRDFQPLLHALVDSGTYVTLVGFDAPAELQEAADIYIPFEAEKATGYTRDDTDPTTPDVVRLLRGGETHANWSSVRGYGRLGEAEVELRSRDSGSPREWCAS